MRTTRHQRQRRAAITQLAIAGALALVILTPRLDVGSQTNAEIKMAGIAPISGSYQPLHQTLGQ